MAKCLNSRIEDEGETINKIALFVDNVLLFVKKKQTNKKTLFSVLALMKCLYEYGSLSGYKMYINKSEAMMISGT